MVKSFAVLRLLFFRRNQNICRFDRKRFFASSVLLRFSLVFRLRCWMTIENYFHRVPLNTHSSWLKIELVRSHTFGAKLLTHLSRFYTHHALYREYVCVFGFRTASPFVSLGA